MDNQLKTNRNASAVVTAPADYSQFYNNIHEFAVPPTDSTGVPSQSVPIYHGEVFDQVAAEGGPKYQSAQPYLLNGRQTELFKALESSNPGLTTKQFGDYWSTSVDGNKSIRDRLPSAGGINFGDAYFSGLTPEAFAKAHPELSIKQNEGVGLSTGYSGSATNSGFAAPTEGFGSALSGTDNSRGRQDMNSATMNGPGYATGGQIGQAPLGAQGPAGLQQPGQQQQISAQMLDASVQDILRRNPQVASQVKQAVDEAIQSGEVTQEQCHQVVQLATAALNNPALWPQLRQWAIQKGMAGEQDIPQEFDQGLVVAILAAAKSYDHGNGNAAQVVPTQAGIQQPGQKQAFATGGQIQGKGTGTSDSIPAVNSSNGQHIKVSNGEFIIPANIVAIKGTEFFENLINKYSQQDEA